MRVRGESERGSSDMGLKVTSLEPTMKKPEVLCCLTNEHRSLVSLNSCSLSSSMEA